jgi:hypothetical protein
MQLFNKKEKRKGKKKKKLSQYAPLVKTQKTAGTGGPFPQM